MADAGRRIAITGASGYLGDRLVRRFEQEDGVELILATDVREPRTGYGPKVAFQYYDVTEPGGSILEDSGVDSLVHLAYVLNPRRNRAAVRRVNVAGAANVLAACRSAGVRYMLYLSSTSVYGAHEDNPPELAESAPPRPAKGFQYSENKLEAERLFEEFANGDPQCAAAILRACPVVGPHADNFIARAFLKPFLVGFRGHDPPMQLIHEDDLTEIIVRCVMGRVAGLYNAAGGGTITWSRMARALGRRRFTLPAPLLNGLVWTSWTLGLQSDSPTAGLSYARHPWTASTEKLTRVLGYTPRRSSAEAWEEFARTRASRSGGAEVTVGREGESPPTRSST